MAKPARDRGSTTRTFGGFSTTSFVFDISEFQYEAYVGDKNHLQSFYDFLAEEFTNTKMLLVNGERGIGKTRFIQELSKHSREITSLVYVCDEEKLETPYVALIDLIEQFFQKFPQKVEEITHLMLEEEVQLLRPFIQKFL